jgi:type IV secretory pathway VirB2 component (pilin)/tetrahydromethanopterin S-methyltransferase subunit F
MTLLIPKLSGSRLGALLFTLQAFWARGHSPRAGGCLPWEKSMNLIATSLTGPVGYASGLIGICVAGATLLFDYEACEVGRRAYIIGWVVTVLIFAARRADFCLRRRWPGGLTMADASKPRFVMIHPSVNSINRPNQLLGRDRELLSITALAATTLGFGFGVLAGVSRAPTRHSHRTWGCAVLRTRQNVTRQFAIAVLAQSHVKERPLTASISQTAAAGREVCREMSEPILRLVAQEDLEDTLFNPGTSLWVKRRGACFVAGIMDPPPALGTGMAWQGLLPKREHPMLETDPPDGRLRMPRPPALGTRHLATSAHWRCIGETYTRRIQTAIQGQFRQGYPAGKRDG